MKGWWFESWLQLSTCQSPCKNPQLSEWFVWMWGGWGWNSTARKKKRFLFRLVVLYSEPQRFAIYILLKQCKTLKTWHKRWACRMSLESLDGNMSGSVCLFFCESVWIQHVLNRPVPVNHTLFHASAMSVTQDPSSYIRVLVFSTSCFIFSGCLCALLIASPTRLCLAFSHVWLASPDSNALLLCPRSSSPVHYTFQNKAKYTQCRHTPDIIN